MDNKKKIDLRNALELAASAQPVDVGSSTINDVSIDFMLIPMVSDPWRTWFLIVFSLCRYICLLLEDWSNF